MITNLKGALPSHFLVAATGAVSRIISALAQFLSIPLLTSALGLEQFALFALLISLQSWFLLSDFGFGSSIQNAISAARANHAPATEVEQLGRYIAISLLFLVLALVWISAPYAAPALLKSFTFLSADEKERLFVLSASLCAGSGIGNIVYKTWYAQRRGYLANALPMIASLISLGGVYFASRIPGEARLGYCVFVFLVPLAFLPLCALISQVARQPRNWPSLGGTQLIQIVRQAAGFWFFAVMTALTLNVDMLIASQVLPTEEIAAYAVASRIFGVAFLCFYALLWALWPVFSEDIVRAQWDSVLSNALICILIGGAALSVFTIAFAANTKLIAGLIAPTAGLVFPVSAVILMGVLFLVRVWTDTFAVVLQSANMLKTLWICVPIQACVSVTMQIALARSHGMPGLIVGITISFLTTVAWVLPVHLVMARRHGARLI